MNEDGLYEEKFSAVILLQWFALFSRILYIHNQGKTLSMAGHIVQQKTVTVLLYYFFSFSFQRTEIDRIIVFTAFII